MWRNSCLSVCRAISAIVPAISTPVGPPPTMTNVSSMRRRSTSLSRSASSNAVSNRRRISRRVFDRFQAGCERLPFRMAEVAVPRPAATISVSYGSCVPSK